jgi:hypothetical protein
MAPLTNPSALSAPTTSTNGRAANHFRFLDLPAELRVQVYEELLIVGKIFYTPDDYAVSNEKRFKDWKAYRTPSLEILRVCKQVHGEAEEVYLGKNLFVLPDFCKLRAPMKGWTSLGPGKSAQIPCHDRHLFSIAASHLLKHVSISFNPRTPIPSGLGHSCWTDRKQYRPSMSFDAMAPVDRIRFTHDVGIADLTDLWAKTLDNVHTCLDGLRSLELDLTNAYCPTGCCRLVTDGLILSASEVPAKLSFIGIRNEQEEADVMDELDEIHTQLDLYYSPGDLEELKEIYSIVFNPETSHWEQWKVESV